MSNDVNVICDLIEDKAAEIANAFNYIKDIVGDFSEEDDKELDKAQTELLNHLRHKFDNSNNDAEKAAIGILIATSDVGDKIISTWLSIHRFNKAHQND